MRAISLRRRKGAFGEAEERAIRDLILTGERIDGRKLNEVRAITGETELLPWAHGSALFTRGETQALVTTTLVIAEGHGWFLRRYDRTKALEYLAMIESMHPLKITSVGLREQGAATDLLRRFSDQDLTIADAVGINLMKARRILTCWSTDFHMGLTGVPLVIHEH